MPAGVSHGLTRAITEQEITSQHCRIDRDRYLLQICTFFTAGVAARARNIRCELAFSLH